MAALTVAKALIGIESCCRVTDLLGHSADRSRDRFSNSVWVQASPSGKLLPIYAFMSSRATWFVVS